MSLQQNQSIQESKMIFKLYFKNQTRLYNQNLNLQNLIKFSKIAFVGLPDKFSLIYQSAKGEITYIESDADLIGLKYCCAVSNDFIVKLTIFAEIKAQIQLNDIEVTNLVKENMEKVYSKVLNEIQSETITQAVSQYLIYTYEKVTTKIANDQEKIMNLEVRDYLQTLYEISSQKLAEEQSRIILQKPKNKRIVRYSPQKPMIFSSERSLDEIVSEKILQLVPSLVDKIFTKMQNQIKNRCVSCLKRQNDLENAINKQIRKRISINLCNLDNPEE